MRENHIERYALVVIVTSFDKIIHDVFLFQYFMIDLE